MAEECPSPHGVLHCSGTHRLRSEELHQLPAATTNTCRTELWEVTSQLLLEAKHCFHGTLCTGYTCFFKHQKLIVIISCQVFICIHVGSGQAMRWGSWGDTPTVQFPQESCLLAWPHCPWKPVLCHHIPLLFKFNPSTVKEAQQFLFLSRASAPRSRFWPFTGSGYIQLRITFHF